MLKNEPKQLSLYSILYNKIPENHILKRINNIVDFSFINKMLEGSYCKYYGRPAKEPEMMAKLLILQYLYNHSDNEVVDETRVNLELILRMTFLILAYLLSLEHKDLRKRRSMTLSRKWLDSV